MGLFGKKDPCAICGGKVKGLFPWKIDGQLICNDCYGHTDVANEILNRMTVQDYKEYMVFREENNRLKERFQITQQIDFGWLDNKFYFDIPNRLMSLDKNMKDTLKQCVEINRLENMADEIRDEAISRILNDENANPILVIKQKELFEEAENVTDMCEHVANVVESIIVKNN